MVVSIQQIVSKGNALRAIYMFMNWLKYWSNNRINIGKIQMETKKKKEREYDVVWARRQRRMSASLFRSLIACVFLFELYALTTTTTVWA